MNTLSVNDIPSNAEVKSTRLSSLDFILYLFLLVWGVSPPLTYSLVCRIGAVAVVLLLAAKVMFKSLIGKGNRYFIILYPLLIALVAGLSLMFNFFLSQINMLIFFSMSVCAWNTVLSPPSRFQRSLFLFISFVLCSFWVYTTYSFLSINPDVMRLLIRNSADSQEFTRFGIGGYGFLYAMILAFPLGIGTATERNEPFLLRMAALWFCISLIMLTFKSKFFLALLLMISGTMFYIAFRFAKQRLTAVVIMFFFFIIALVFAEEILTLLIKMIDIPALQHKLADTRALLSGDLDVTDSEFSTRGERYTRDLGLIFDSPLWGCLNFEQVGKHSHLLDFAAIFGLPIAITYVNFCWTTLKKFIRQHSASVPACVLVMSVLLSMNSLAYPFGSAVFILLPIFASKEFNQGEESN